MPWGLVILAYFVGSLPVAYLLTHAWLGIDIQRVGSGNAGATNVLRNVGCLPAAAASLPIFLQARHLAGWSEPGDGWLVAASALTAAIIIHMHRPNMARLLAGVETKIGVSRGRELT